MRKTILSIFLTLLLFSVPNHCLALHQDVQKTIDMITDQLETAGSDIDKAKLYCFRARNYHKLGEKDKAENDYLAALSNNYAGWLLVEYGFFLYHNEEYEKSYAVALKVLEDFPYLKADAKKLGSQSRDKYEEKYYEENPPTIVMNTVVDPNRKTRHDYKRYSGPKVINFNKLDSPGRTS